MGQNVDICWAKKDTDINRVSFAVVDAMNRDRVTKKEEGLILEMVGVVMEEKNE